jgi:hypothetical protein
MSTPLLDRILRESQGANLLDLLTEQLPPTDLQSLLLEVYRRRAAQQTPASLLSSYERSHFARPSPASPVALLDIDRLAFSLAAPLFEPLELAPVCPLGTSSVVASVDQNKALATIRNTEVISDSTNVLALECAVRRRAHLRAAGQRHQRVHLCASQRLLRPQAFSGPASFAHFRLFGLCSAGRDEGSYRFELAALAAQLAFYLRLLAALRAGGYAIQQVRLAITNLADAARQEAVRAEIMEALAGQFPRVQCGFDPDRSAGRNYYDGLCFAIYASDAANQEYMLVDGGFTTWTQQLLSNRKERLLISGMGTERLCSVFHIPLG